MYVEADGVDSVVRGGAGAGAAHEVRPLVVVRRRRRRRRASGRGARAARHEVTPVIIRRAALLTVRRRRVLAHPAVNLPLKRRQRLHRIEPRQVLQV